MVPRAIPLALVQHAKDIVYRPIALSVHLRRSVSSACRTNSKFDKSLQTPISSGRGNVVASPRLLCRPDSSGLLAMTASSHYSMSKGAGKLKPPSSLFPYDQREGVKSLITHCYPQGIVNPRPAKYRPHRPRTHSGFTVVALKPRLPGDVNSLIRRDCQEELAVGVRVCLLKQPVSLSLRQARACMSSTILFIYRVIDIANVLPATLSP